MTDLYLCGAGNPEGVRLALAVQETRPSPPWRRIAVLDDDPTCHGSTMLGVPVIGGFDTLGVVPLGDAQVVNLVARTTGRRHAARRRIARYGHPFAALVHPTVDTRGTHLAPDVLVYERAVVSPGARVGDGSVLFMGAMAGHGSRVGRGCVLAAGSVLNARVTVGDMVYVGTNATVLPDLQVGPEATVGACSAVVHDVPRGATALGVPAEVLLPRCSDPADRTAREATETVVRYAPGHRAWCPMEG